MGLVATIMDSTETISIITERSIGQHELDPECVFFFLLESEYT